MLILIFSLGIVHRLFVSILGVQNCMVGGTTFGFGAPIARFLAVEGPLQKMQCSGSVVAHGTQSIEA